jgi:hypothetical protein
VSRIADFSRLALLATASGLAASRAARLSLDVENRSMRSARSEGARVEAVREALFGKDALLVLLLEPADETKAEEPGHLAALARWEEALRGSPAARSVLPLPGARPGERLLALGLAPDAAGSVASALDELRATAEREKLPEQRLSISGPPAAEAAIASALEREQRRIVPLVGAVLFALLLVVYRSPSLALGALLPALGGIAGTGALQQALGFAVNPVTALLPPVLLAVGVAGSVHLIDAFLDERHHGASPERASRRAARAILAPALGCAATTVVGFLALGASPIPAVRRFGALAAGGVALTALLAFALLPPWLRCFAGGARLVPRAAGFGRWRRLGSALALGLRRAAPLLSRAAMLVSLVLAIAWTRLTIDTDPIGILPRAHPFRLATERIGERLGGTETFDLLLEPPAPAGGGASLLGLQARLCELPGVVRPGGMPRVAADGSALVPALLAPGGTSAREALFARAEELGRELGWQGVHATGPAVRTARDSGAIARGEFLGLFATFLALGPCVWIGLRSLRLTALGLAANALPCLLLHGGLALAGRPLSVASAMIGSVILGLVVDDAIYFLHGYRAAERAGHAPLSGCARTLRRSGRALLVTSLVLALGFLAGLAGDLATTREFGLLAAGTILAALGANLLLLPALLLRRGVRAPRAPQARWRARAESA